MGQEKCNGEIKNTHKFSFTTPEKKRQFRRYRPR
jgi:hypothetical protein